LSSACGIHRSTGSELAHPAAAAAAAAAAALRQGAGVFGTAALSVRLSAREHPVAARVLVL